MKTYILSLLTYITLGAAAQVNYPSQNIDLISHITPNPGPSGVDGRLYSGCWGWHQQSKSKEYAISGTSNGTYFIDVTNPATPVVCDYVGGKQGCTWREMKTYQNYCYIISDDARPNTFQIVDMQYLPDSVHVVHNDSSIFERGHTIWIDQDKMYIGMVTYTNGFSSMNVYSLATPSVPVLLRELAQDIGPPLLNEVHDMYVRNDTVYASAGWAGLFVIKFNTATNTFSQLGSYAGYAPSASYNHSSMLTQNSKYLVFCDEVPAGRPINIVNVQNLANIQPVQTMNPYSTTTPHNPYVLGNDFAVIACYQEGLYIYDISQPATPAVSGSFDTHPQGGGDLGNYFGNDYRGNWGAYPYLPSGIIIAQDMQNGVFILDPSKAFTNRVGIDKNTLSSVPLMAYPNPASEALTLSASTTDRAQIQIKNLLGQVIYETQAEAPLNTTIDTHHLPNGTYMVSITGNRSSTHKKIIIHH